MASSHCAWSTPGGGNGLPSSPSGGGGGSGSPFAPVGGGSGLPSSPSGGVGAPGGGVAPSGGGPGGAPSGGAGMPCSVRQSVNASWGAAAGADGAADVDAEADVAAEVSGDSVFEPDEHATIPVTRAAPVTPKTAARSVDKDTFTSSVVGARLTLFRLARLELSAHWEPAVRLVAKRCQVTTRRHDEESSTPRSVAVNHNRSPRPEVRASCWGRVPASNMPWWRPATSGRRPRTADPRLGRAPAGHRARTGSAHTCRARAAVKWGPAAGPPTNMRRGVLLRQADLPRGMIAASADEP